MGDPIPADGPAAEKGDILARGGAEAASARPTLENAAALLPAGLLPAQAAGAKKMVDLVKDQILLTNVSGASDQRSAVQRLVMAGGSRQLFEATVRGIAKLPSAQAVVADDIISELQLFDRGNRQPVKEKEDELIQVNRAVTATETGTTQQHLERAKDAMAAEPARLALRRQLAERKQALDRLAAKLQDAKNYDKTGIAGLGPRKLKEGVLSAGDRTLLEEARAIQAEGYKLETVINLAVPQARSGDREALQAVAGRLEASGAVDSGLVEGIDKALEIATENIPAQSGSAYILPDGISKVTAETQTVLESLGLSEGQIGVLIQATADERSWREYLKRNIPDEKLQTKVKAAVEKHPRTKLRTALQQEQENREAELETVRAAADARENDMLAKTLGESAVAGQDLRISDISQWSNRSLLESAAAGQLEAAAVTLIDRTAKQDLGPAELFKFFPDEARRVLMQETAAADQAAAKLNEYISANPVFAGRPDLNRNVDWDAIGEMMQAASGEAARKPPEKFDSPQMVTKFHPEPPPGRLMSFYAKQAGEIVTFVPSENTRQAAVFSLRAGEVAAAMGDAVYVPVKDETWKAGWPLAMAAGGETAAARQKETDIGQLADTVNKLSGEQAQIVRRLLSLPEAGRIEAAEGEITVNGKKAEGWQLRQYAAVEQPDKAPWDSSRYRGTVAPMAREDFKPGTTVLGRNNKGDFFIAGAMADGSIYFKSCNQNVTPEIYGYLRAKDSYEFFRWQQADGFTVIAICSSDSGENRRFSAELDRRNRAAAEDRRQEAVDLLAKAPETRAIYGLLQHSGYSPDIDYAAAELVKPEDGDLQLFDKQIAQTWLSGENQPHRKLQQGTVVLIEQSYLGKKSLELWLKTGSDEYRMLGGNGGSGRGVQSAKEMGNPLAIWSRKADAGRLDSDALLTKAQESHNSAITYRLKAEIESASSQQAAIGAEFFAAARASNMTGRMTARIIDGMNFLPIDRDRQPKAQEVSLGHLLDAAGPERLFRTGENGCYLLEETIPGAGGQEARTERCIAYVSNIKGQAPRTPYDADLREARIVLFKESADSPQVVDFKMSEAGRGQFKVLGRLGPKNAQQDEKTVLAEAVTEWKTAREEAERKGDFGRFGKLREKTSGNPLVNQPVNALFNLASPPTIDDIARPVIDAQKLINGDRWPSPQPQKLSQVPPGMACVMYDMNGGLGQYAEFVLSVGGINPYGMRVHDGYRYGTDSWKPAADKTVALVIDVDSILRRNGISLPDKSDSHYHAELLRALRNLR